LNGLIVTSLFQSIFKHSTHPVPTQPTTRAHLRGCHRRPHPAHMPGSDAQAPPQSAQRHTQQRVI